jgi:hypothetical protein
MVQTSEQVELKGALFPRGIQTTVVTNQSFPYGAVGRVITHLPNGALGVCTAALVGPRHILTSSHCATWTNLNDDSPPSPIGFQPGYSDGELFPFSSVIYSYWDIKLQIGAPAPHDASVGGDYLIGVLDRRYDVTNDMFGVKEWDQLWINNIWWSMLGYPYDLTQSNRLVYRGVFAGSVNFQSQYGIRVKFDVITSVGDSGGPIYGWWSGRPSIVAVTSGAAAGSPGMIGHGGDSMVDMWNEALKDWT